MCDQLFPARPWFGYDETNPPGCFVLHWLEATLRVDDKVRHCVVFLGYAHGPGSFVPYGTGFLVAVPTGDRAFQHVVTAKHVVDSIPGDIVFARINPKRGMPEIAALPKRDWFFHPEAKSGREIDVAVCPSHVPFDSYEIIHVRIDRDMASNHVIEERGIGIGDEVFITGMFTSHIGERRNVPVVRVGNIAAMPEEPIWTPAGYMDAYLVEARSIGGLSGSPVFVHMAPLRVIDGNVTPTKGRVWYLLGLVHGHFVIENPNDAVTEEGGSAGKINTGIGVVVPAEKILETIHHPDLQTKRAAIVEQLKKESRVVPDSAESAPPTTANNPQHREDFNRLLDAAARKPKRGGRT